jgi:hypothetical protein
VLPFIPVLAPKVIRVIRRELGKYAPGGRGERDPSANDKDVRLTHPG